VHGRETRPASIGGEELTHLLFAGTRSGIAAAERPSDMLEQSEVAGGKLVVATLPVQRECLDRPWPDATDRVQAPPAALVIGIVQIDVPACNLTGNAHEQVGARLGEIEGMQASRGNGREHARRGHVAQLTGAPLPTDPARPELTHDPPLDPGGALELDQLLADRPGERLKRLRTASHAQPRAASHGASDQRIVGELTNESCEIVIDTQREAHTFDPMLRRRPAARARPEQDELRATLGHPYVHGLPTVVQQPLEHPRATAQHAVHATLQRQSVGRGGSHLHAQLDRLWR
jgi:hypothetical protein